MLLTLPLAKLWWPKTKFIYDVHEDFANLLLIRDWLPVWLKPIVRFLTDKIEKGLAALADAIVAVTPPLLNKFGNKTGITAFNYVSRAFLDQARCSARAAGEREFDLVHLGSLNLERGLFLADIIREFHGMKPSARSMVIGIPPELKQAMQSRVPDRCILLGKTPHQEIPKLLGNSKVGLDVHPWTAPHLEVALPVKVCEYMVAGCAVVTSAMPVLRETLARAGANGEVTLINGGTPRDYADAAFRTIQAIRAGADPGARLAQLASDHLTWEGEAKKIGDLYLQLLGKPCAT